MQKRLFFSNHASAIDYYKTEARKTKICGNMVRFRAIDVDYEWINLNQL